MQRMANPAEVYDRFRLTVKCGISAEWRNGEHAFSTLNCCHEWAPPARHLCVDNITIDPISDQVGVREE